MLQVVPTAEVTPPQSNGWKLTVAGILLVLLVASSVQLSLVANITKLPKVCRTCNQWLRFGDDMGQQQQQQQCVQIGVCV